MTNLTDIRDFLRAHCARYPELALQDVFKALYQSAFGCEHLIADPSAAADYIRAEAAQHIQHRAVALRRVGRKARDRDAGGRERAQAQEKRGVRPVARHMAPVSYTPLTLPASDPV